jgi:hypothetical protein
MLQSKATISGHACVFESAPVSAVLRPLYSFSVSRLCVLRSSVTSQMRHVLDQLAQ